MAKDKTAAPQPQKVDPRASYENQLVSAMDKVITCLDKVNKLARRKGIVLAEDYPKIDNAVRAKLDEIASTYKATLAGKTVKQSTFSL